MAHFFLRHRDRRRTPPDKRLTIALASGKGGTGKTTVATSLAVSAAQTGASAGYLDADVEEPNGALFLKPVIDQTRPVEVGIPVVDPESCTGCGECSRICRFSAIVVVNGKPMVFPELCHSCGGCLLVCPQRAISESFRHTGRVEMGHAGPVRFVQGILDIGETLSPTVIRAARRCAPVVDTLIIDAPPGTACPVIETVRDVDFVILVAEPTPFGLNDLALAVDMLRAVKRPFGVVINRADEHRRLIQDYCRREDIEVLAVIADDRRIAEAYSRGELIVEAVPEYRPVFVSLLEIVTARAAGRVDTESVRP